MGKNGTGETKGEAIIDAKSLRIGKVSTFYFKEVPRIKSRRAETKSNEVKRGCMRRTDITCSECNEHMSST